MGTYLYRVRTTTGVVSGNVQAKDKSEAEKKVRDRHKHDLNEIISLEKK